MLYLWRNDPANKKAVIVAVTHPSDDGMVRNVLDLAGNILAGNPAWIDAAISTMPFEDWVEKHFEDLDRYRFPLRSKERRDMAKALHEMLLTAGVEPPNWLKLESNA